MSGLVNKVGSVPLHWAVLVGFVVFLGCAGGDCDPDDTECEPAVFDNPVDPDTPPTSDDYTADSCPAAGGPDCVDLDGFSQHLPFSEFFDSETFEIGDEVVHFGIGVVQASGATEIVGWSERTGQVIYRAIVPGGGTAGLSSILDVNNDGSEDLLWAAENVVSVFINNGTDLDDPEDFASYTGTGEVIGFEVGLSATYKFFHISTPFATESYSLLGPWNGQPLVPTENKPVPANFRIGATVGGDFLNNGFPGLMELWVDQSDLSCAKVFSFSDASGNTPRNCGGDKAVLLDCNQAAVADLEGDGIQDDLLWCGVTDDGSPGCGLALGSTGNAASACDDGFGLGNSQSLTVPGTGRVSSVLTYTIGPGGNVIFGLTLEDDDSASFWEVFRPGPRAPGDVSPTGPMPVVEPDPLNPYPTGGTPKAIIAGRDVTRDGLPDLLTVNTDPGNFTAIFSSVSTAPVPRRLDGRITADEPWLNNENAMPVGLIGDMLLVGIPKDTEGAGVATGAVFVFKREGNRWVQQQKIIPVDPQLGMRFGYSLAVEEQIDTGEAWMIVGSRTFNNFEGRVDFYERVGDTWVHAQTLTTGENIFFGWDVDINVDIPIGQGDPEWTAVIGAPSYRFPGNNNNTGAVFISSRTTGFWSPPAIPLNSETVLDNNIGVGRAVAIDGDVVIAGAYSQPIEGNSSAGAVYIFSRGEFSPWVLSNQILNPNPLPGEINGAHFGFSVDVVKQVVNPRIPTGNYYFLIGAPNNTSEYQGGEVYMFGGGNSGYQRFRRPGGGSFNDRFGFAVAFRDDLIRGNHLFVASTSILQTGSAYLFDQPDFPEPWVPIAEVEIPNTDVSPAATAIISESLAAWDDYVAVATSNLTTGNDAVYVDVVPILIARFEQGD